MNLIGLRWEKICLYYFPILGKKYIVKTNEKWEEYLTIMFANIAMLSPYFMEKHIFQFVLQLFGLLASIVRFFSYSQCASLKQQKRSSFSMKSKRICSSLEIKSYYTVAWAFAFEKWPCIWVVAKILTMHYCRYGPVLETANVPYPCNRVMAFQSATSKIFLLEAGNYIFDIAYLNDFNG